MFGIENFTQTFHTLLMNAINLKPATEINKKYSHAEIYCLVDRNSDTAFLTRQITKHHQIFDRACSHINDHPNMANDTLSRHFLSN